MRKLLKKTISVTVCLALLIASTSLLRTDKTKAAADISAPVKSGDDTIYSTLYFGSYPQSEVSASEVEGATYEFADSKQSLKDGELNIHTDSNNFYASYGSEDKKYYKFEPLKWRVLDLDGDTALLLADSIIDARALTGSDFNIEEWLNNTGSKKSWYGLKNFYMMAFSKSLNGQNARPENYLLPLSEENDDVKVKFLSGDDIYNTSYGFNSNNVYDSARKGTMTAFAKALVSSSSEDCYWIEEGTSAMSSYVDKDGKIATNAVVNYMGIRPLIKIDIKKAMNDGFASISEPETPVGPLPTVNPSASPSSSASPDVSASPATGESASPVESSSTVSVPKISSFKAKKSSVKSGIKVNPAVKLSWKYKGNMSGVIIYKATGKGKLKKYKSLSTAKKAFTDKKADYGKKYTYRVGPTYKDGSSLKQGALSAKKKVSIKVPKTLKKPVFTTVKKGNSLKLTFKKVEGTNFQTQYKYNTDKSWAALPSLGGKVKKSITKPLKATGFKIRIRTYKVINKKKVYSAWVTSKSI